MNKIFILTLLMTLVYSSNRTIKKTFIKDLAAEILDGLEGSPKEKLEDSVFMAPTLTEGEDGEQEKQNFWKTYMRKLPRDRTERKLISRPVQEWNFNEYNPSKFSNYEKDEFNKIDSNKQDDYSRLLDSYTKVMYAYKNRQKDFDNAEKYIRTNSFSNADLISIENVAKFKSLQNAPQLSDRLTKKQKSRRESLDDIFESAKFKNEKLENMLKEYIWEIVEKVKLQIDNKMDWNDFENGSALLMTNYVEQMGAIEYIEPLDCFQKSASYPKEVKPSPQKEYLSDDY